MSFSNVVNKRGYYLMQYVTNIIQKFKGIYNEKNITGYTYSSSVQEMK